MKSQIYLEYNSHLRAIPSIHGRVMFCVLVQQACAEYKPAVIAVELPPSLGEATREVWKSLNQIRRGYPPLLMLARLKKSPHSLADYAGVLQIGPGDSLIEAVRCGLEYNIPVEFIDSESRQEQNEERRRMLEWPIKDGMLLEEGLDVFYNRVSKELQSARIDEIDSPREECMASQLKHLLEKGKKVLLVCGAVHWEQICNLLGSSRRLSSVDNPSDERNLVKVLCTGTTIFSQYNSDLPAVVFNYEILRRRGQAQNFNHEKAWQNILKRILKRLEKNEEGPNAREFMNFFEFLNRLCIHTGLLSPSLHHLYHASRSCGSEALFQIVCEEAMRYPARCPSDDSLPLPLGQLTEIQAGGNEISAKIDGQRVVLVGQQPLEFVYVRRTPIRREETESKDEPQPTSEINSGGIKKSGDNLDKIKKSSIKFLIRLFFNKQLLKKLLRDFFFKNTLNQSPEETIPEYLEEALTPFIQAFGNLHFDSDKNIILPWSTDESTRQLNKMSLRARILARVNTESLSYIEANGVYRGVPDIQRIIRARTRGDSRIYMKAMHTSRLSSKNIFEKFDPIVWIFHPYDEKRESTMDGGIQTGNIFYAANSMYFEKKPANAIDTVCFYLGAIAVFTPDHPVNEIPRLLRWIKSGNQKYVPQKSVWAADSPIYSGLTPEERSISFEKHEILFLAAIHYARKYVIWISDRTLLPNRLLRTICKRQRKSVVCLTLDDFPDDEVEKLRNYEYRVPSEFIDWAADEIYKKRTDFVNALYSSLSES